MTFVKPKPPAVPPSPAKPKAPLRSPRSRWAELHYRSRLPVADQAAELAWIAKLADAMAGPCNCRRHWREALEARPPTIETPEAYEAWAVAEHNAVNERLGKPTYTVQEARALPYAVQGPLILPDKIVVLSLDSRPDRWAAVTASIATSDVLRGVPVERWRARPPSEFIVPDWWTWGDTIYATGIDHRDIIERAYADGLANVLILEDDAILQPCFDEAYRAAFGPLPADWLGLWLTSDGHKRPPVPVGPGLVRCTDQAMLHAYMLNRRGMRRVWHHLVTCYRQIVDGATEDLHGLEPHFYATAANAVRQFGDRFIGERVKFWATA